jgi:hypothetical protein
MSHASKRFLFLQFPAVALAIGLIAQLLAWPLSSVVMRRNRTDELALAVGNDTTNYRIVLLGDSITRNATARYALGSPGEVANLATHAHFGLAGELLLLRRYLKVHEPPQYVVLAFAPAMYSWVSDIRLVRYNLWHTFREKDERSFLKRYLPDIDRGNQLPAAADLQVRIVEPLFSLIKQAYLASRHRASAYIGTGFEYPDGNAAVDISQRMAPILNAAIAEGLNTILPPVNAEALRQVCDLSQRHGFRIKLVWPPMAAELERAFVASGALPQLEGHIRAIAANHCQVDQIGEIFDFNKARTYGSSSFHRDMVHLFGDGWERSYASDLRKYLTALPDRDLTIEVKQKPAAEL